MSAEADIYPYQAPDLADEIDANIGEGSRFHETHGYYAQGVGPETAILPLGPQTGRARVATAEPTCQCLLGFDQKFRLGLHEVNCRSVKGHALQVLSFVAGLLSRDTNLNSGPCAAGLSRSRSGGSGLHGVTRKKRQFRALEMVDTMPLGPDEQRRLRAAIRRWTKTLREAGHQIAEE